VAAQQLNQPVVMGRVAAPYAVKGWLKIQPFTEVVDGLLDYPHWLIGRDVGGDASWRRMAVLEAKVHGRFLLVQLDGVADRTAAEAVVGMEIAVDRADLPEPSVGEYYWDQLIGLEVVGHEGVILGRVERILETGGHDLLCVKGYTDEGHADGRERLIPFVAPIVREVMLATEHGAGQIAVEWAVDY